MLKVREMQDCVTDVAALMESRAVAGCRVNPPSQFWEATP